MLTPYKLRLFYILKTRLIEMKLYSTQKTILIYFIKNIYKLSIEEIILAHIQFS